MDDKSDSQPSDRGGVGGARKPYRTPVLTEYGSVAKLTQGSYTKGNDYPQGKGRNPCL